MKVVGIVFFAAFAIFFLSGPAFVVAESFEVTYENVNPSDGGVKYGFKRLKEKGALFVLSLTPKRKADYYIKIINRRLSELKYIVDNDDRSQIENGSMRYAALAGRATEFVVEKDLDRTRLRQLLENHLDVLNELTKKYDTTTAEWRFVKGDYDYVQTYKSKL